MSPEKELELVKKYPTVFKNIHGDPTETCMAWGICVGDGWYNILDELCAVMEECGVTAAQIKEKFGGLRFYTEPYDSEYRDKIHAAIDRAEEQAYRTCERCGKPGRMTKEGWIKVLCYECGWDK